MTSPHASRSLAAILFFAGALTLGAPARAVELIETPGLYDMVAAGKLPGVAKRAPAAPGIVDVVGTPRSGGELRVLMGRAQDVRMMVVYGYSRLVGYTPDFKILPDIAERLDIEDTRVFTFKLRAGHRWSDGRPFTGEDFRYFWEDVALNKNLSPAGPPSQMMVRGKAPKFALIDETTVRFSWDEPNPEFVAALAGAAPLYIYRPAHYLKQFHEKYADKDKLAEVVKARGVRNWAALHNRVDNQYRNDNPDLPTLDPWVLSTRPPADRFVFERNPYYHRVDSAGRQLPYLDRVVMNIADPKLVPAKTGAGEADLQARYVSFNNYTFLKQAANRNNYQVHLWRTARGAHLALYPNLNVNDPVWRKLIRDERFRRALSLSIDRHEINQVIYFGLALEGGNTVLPDSPLSKPNYRTSWATLDIKRANALLDEIGLTKRNDKGVRLLPDGRPLEIIVETSGEEVEQTDVLELIHDSWMKAGVKLYAKPSQREVLRNRVFAGKTVMSIWYGFENGVPTADMSPMALAPTAQDSLQWPKWGQHYDSAGKGGEPVDMPLAKELLTLVDEWRKATSAEGRERIWHRMLSIHADQVYSIGLVGGVLQPVIVNNRLRGVPEKGIFNFEPGAFFGIYHPDTFWWAAPNETAEAVKK